MHDLVGVSFAPNSLRLAFLIDEVIDPSDCEYKLLKPGGVIWSAFAVSIPVPARDDDDENDTEGDDIPWKDARFTESWATAVFYDSGGRWRKLEYGVKDLYGIDPELPDPDPPPEPEPSGMPDRRSGKVSPTKKRRS